MLVFAALLILLIAVSDTVPQAFAIQDDTSSESTYILSINSQDFQIYWAAQNKESGNSILEVEIDGSSLQIVLQREKFAEDYLTLTLPRALIDAKDNQNMDMPFLAFPYGDVVDYDSIDWNRIFDSDDYSLPLEELISDNEEMTRKIRLQLVPDPEYDVVRIIGTQILSVPKQDLAHVTVMFGSSDVHTTRFFKPEEYLVLARGMTVQWFNSDNVTHHIVSGTSANETNAGNVFDSGLLHPRKVFHSRFNETGDYPYFCTIHPWMTGRIMVEENRLMTLDAEKTVYALGEQIDFKGRVVPFRGSGPIYIDMKSSLSDEWQQHYPNAYSGAFNYFGDYSLGLRMPGPGHWQVRTSYHELNATNSVFAMVPNIIPIAVSISQTTNEPVFSGPGDISIVRGSHVLWSNGLDAKALSITIVNTADNQVVFKVLDIDQISDCKSL